MNDVNQQLAHIKKDAEGPIREDHLLIDHCNSVAALAESFANEFGNGDWVKVAGLLHDLGKFNPEWQAYLMRSNGEYGEGEIYEKNSRGKIDHSAAGAI